ncbi:MAG TPA: tripartite tricarboxylate transporter substrate binding protein [Xanthobacteraceae bacterium]|nr:tripartite tricarboxylate transporter substrate binding protein [Xanthobacteraceae bacterium]
MYDRRDFLLAAVLIGLGTSAQAQEKYPTRPIRLLVPFPAGGPVDVMGRLIGQKLSLTLGQQVIIENRPGAGSTLAARAAASADADGYTLLVASAASLAIGPALYNNIGYDPATSFAPIALVSSVPYVMIAGPSVAAKTLPDLVAYAKTNPGRLNIGVPNGAPPHMIAAWFRSVTATDVVIVPYKGASNVITDLMGGQIDLGFETTSVTFGHVHEGKVRALGVATRSRLPELPDVPTMIESGLPDFVASSWTGIVAPAATPKDIIGKLNAEVNVGLKSPEMQDRFKKLAAETSPGTPEDFAAFIVREVPKWQAMAKLAGVKAE